VLEAGARSVLAATRFGDVRWFREIDSTNRWVLEQARAGAPEGLVAVADHQTAGRGRLGRTWSAPPGGSLLASILLRPDLPPDALHLVTAAVALAASDACRAVAGVEPGLKWPNDLLVDDRKLAGVLAEADLGSTGGPAVVVGIGINVNWPDPLPGELEATATSLDRAAGRPVGREPLLVELLVGLERRYAGLGDAGGRAALASEYRTRCSTIGRDVRVELADESFTGSACDVNDAGQLLVSTDACLRTISAGDVVHLRPL
jgi:BirA family transcriptional regulator, biotin operon repressor / biotin---[acetyl-CoA-carboxylase] ligase